MSARTEPRSVARGSAEHYTWGDGCDGWYHLRRDDLAVIQERMPAGTSEVRHYHARARQVFYVLAGELTIELDGTTHTLGARESLEVAPGLAHQVMNRSGEACEFLVVSQPTTRGDRVDLAP